MKSALGGSEEKGNPRRSKCPTFVWEKTVSSEKVNGMSGGIPKGGKKKKKNGTLFSIVTLEDRTLVTAEEAGVRYRKRRVQPRRGKSRGKITKKKNSACWTEKIRQKPKTSNGSPN